MKPTSAAVSFLLSAGIVTAQATRPNATSTVQFKPFLNNGVNPDESTNQMVNGTGVWSWTVDVYNVPIADGGSSFEDPHIASTVHRFEWPGGGNLASALNGSTAPVCATILTGDLLPTVTNSWTADDPGTVDCVGVLGTNCVVAMQRALDSDGHCSAPNPMWTDLRECSGTLGASIGYSQGGLGTATYNLNLQTRDGILMGETGEKYDACNVTDHDENVCGGMWSGSPSGTAFWDEPENTSDGNNLTSYYLATNKLQVMVLAVPHISDDGTSGTIMNSLCMRVNASDHAPSSTDNSPSTSSEAPSATSSGAGVQASMVNLGSVAGVLGIGTVMHLLW